MTRFNEPYISGKEIIYIKDVIKKGRTAGGGEYTKKCESILEDLISCKKALLTHSCTAALEMAAMLMKVKPGDEVIMPSYTFVSTANAFVLRGAVPVFVDISKDNFCLDANKIEVSISNKTVGIVPVHYGGLCSDMDKISNIANEFNLFIVEDAAQSLGCSYKGKKLGSFGSLSTLSFHETKNLNSGEGGALCINDESLIESAEIIREKGTNRSRFFRGQVDKYSWVDIGSSYIPSELNAAFLLAQLESIDVAQASREKIWKFYERSLINNIDLLIPQSFIQESHNCHIFPVITKNLTERQELLNFMNSKGINAVFHYVPLHDSEAGKRFGIASEDLSVTNNLPDRLIRLPIYSNMLIEDAEKVVSTLLEFYE
jgi:dTDP-4-amino-4,6-dideoxygalactose transaminase